ncbi:hypothetical protein [uncultured Winogradskyella sp.]|uniref:hypothetical protein n=1 Tax=uncultured Winogradskyella sp. TaxID=395353 RepID=UPI002627F444|nr:hypothetical protein [uncultured Winogradskyella sp.]
MGVILIGTTFAFNDKVKVELNETITSSEDFIKRCCTRTATNGDERATVRKCSENADSAVAYGDACRSANFAAQRALGASVEVIEDKD